MKHYQILIKETPSGLAPFVFEAPEIPDPIYINVDGNEISGRYSRIVVNNQNDEIKQSWIKAKQHAFESAKQSAVPFENPEEVSDLIMGMYNMREGAFQIYKEGDTFDMPKGWRVEMWHQVKSVTGSRYTDISEKYYQSLKGLGDDVRIVARLIQTEPTAPEDKKSHKCPKYAQIICDCKEGICWQQNRVDGWELEAKLKLAFNAGIACNDLHPDDDSYDKVHFERVLKEIIKPLSEDKPVHAKVEIIKIETGQIINVEGNLFMFGKIVSTGEIECFKV